MTGGSLTTTAVTFDKIRGANWNGSIPIVLRLAPTSLSSPTIPPPIHVLVSRQTYLHVGLRQAVMKFYQFAPPILSFQRSGVRKVIEEPSPGSGEGGSLSSLQEDDREDKDEKKLMEKNEKEHATAEANKDESSTSSSNVSKRLPQQRHHKEDAYPVCWFEDQATELPLRWHLFVGVLWDSLHGNDDASQQQAQDPPIPWKIQLHFTSYPSSQLLAIDSGVLWTVERTYKNSMKQALVLQHGHSKVALNMTKQTHERLWDSILQSKYALYRPIHGEIQAETVQLLPLRVLVVVDRSIKPPLQKKCEATPDLSMGQVLLDWVPEYFERSTTTNDENVHNEGNESGIQVKSSSIIWRVAGIAPPLSAGVIDLWRTLHHPDLFLYIVVLINY